MLSQIERRPILSLLAGLIVGLTLGLHPINLLLLAPVFWFYKSLPIRIATAALVAFGALISPRPAPQVNQIMPVIGTGRIVSAPRLYKEVTTFDLEIQGHRFGTTIEGNPFVAYGDSIRVVGQVRPLREGTENTMGMRGLEGRLRVVEWSLATPALPPLRWAEGWRRSFISFTESVLPQNISDVVNAICFNLDTALTDEIKQDLQRTGTIHIVSVSGLHVVALALALVWSLSMAPIPRWAQLAAAVLLLSFYAVAAGMNPPVVRSVLMVLIAFSGYIFSREPDTLAALGIAAILYLLWRPASVYDIGFQLSFLTVASFGLFLRPERDSFQPPLQKFFADAKSVAMVSLVATLASAPIVGYHFGQVSLISVLANLLIAISVPAMIIVAMSAHLLSFIVPSLAAWVMQSFVLGWTGWLMLVLDHLSDPPWAVLQIPAFNAYWLLPMYAGVLLIWRPQVRTA